MDRTIRLIGVIFLGGILVFQILILQRLSCPIHVSEPIQVTTSPTTRLHRTQDEVITVRVEGPVEVEAWTPIPVKIR